MEQHSYYTCNYRSGIGSELGLTHLHVEGGDRELALLLVEEGFKRHSAPGKVVQVERQIKGPQFSIESESYQAHTPITEEKPQVREFIATSCYEREADARSMLRLIIPRIKQGDVVEAELPVAKIDRDGEIWGELTLPAHIDLGLDGFSSIQTKPFEVHHCINIESQDRELTGLIDSIAKLDLLRQKLTRAGVSVGTLLQYSRDASLTQLKLRTSAFASPESVKEFARTAHTRIREVVEAEIPQSVSASIKTFVELIRGLWRG